MLDVPRVSVEGLCLSHRVRELSLFGSAVRSDFGERSDVDVLVEFQPDAHPTPFALADPQAALEAVFPGRRVDLVTKDSVSPYLADRILGERGVIYGSP